MRIFLIGMPGCGKSSLGYSLSRKIEMHYIDLDHVIEKKEDMSITSIFDQKGEEYFRRIEHDILIQFCTGENDNFIMAAGGGTPCFFDNLNHMNSAGKTIYLKVDVDILVKRLQSKISDRPLLNDVGDLKMHLESLLESRNSWYNKANITLDSNDLTADGLLTAVLNIKS